MKKQYLHHLNEIMANQWNDPALSDYGETQGYTYGQLAEKMLRLHTLFRELGIKKGDKIALCGRNCANWAVAYLAIASYEAVVVSILQDFQPTDIQNLIRHSDSKLLFVGPYVWRELQNEPLSELTAAISLSDFSVLRSGEGVEIPSEEALEKAFTEEHPHGIHPENICFSADQNALAIINYTSGSTGSPKGVMLDGRALSNNVEIAIDILPVPEDCKRLVSILPLAHAFGQLADFLYPICSGCHITFLTKSPTPAILLKALQEVKPYILTMVPLVIEKIYKAKISLQISKGIVRALWHVPGIGDIVKKKVKTALTTSFGGNIRYFLLGGAALNAEVEDCLMDIHFPLSIGYGMTECAPLISGSNPKYFKARSCGAIVSGMECRIDNPNEEGVGEVLVKGENCMLGYYKNEEATKAAFTEDGWMRTGDLGYLDKKNFIHLKGRNKTMILGSSGQNIYPEEIEDKLNNLEGVGESIVVEREGKLVGLVFPDEQTTKRLSLEEIENMMRENLQKLNKLIPGYSRVSDIEIKEEPFEKTPKKSIKRFLYK